MNIKFKWVLTGYMSIILAFISTTVHSTETDDVTTVWTEVANNALGDVESEGIGWALSAIGLSGGSSDINTLGDIKVELKAIELDLSNMSVQLGQILNAINNQTCTQLESGEVATAVNHIQSLYDDYQNNIIQVAEAGNPVVFNINIWIKNVLDQNTGVAQNLNTIHSLVLSNTANIIDTCTTSITGDYLSNTGPSGPLANPFNDLAYYAPIQNIINYYYGIQTLGAALLVEVYHLQACQAASSTDCDFSTISTGTLPTDSSDICTNAVTGTPTASFCQQATQVVTNPTNGTGVYERVKAQVTAAGAPYSWNDKLGIVWGNETPILMPKSLEDFTNSATFANGALISPNGCSTPLSSDTPCGYTIGVYNGEFDAGIRYSYYGGVSDQKIWNNIPSGQLDDNALWSGLYDPYNNYIKNKVVPPSNDPDNPIIIVTGSIADYMNSIGFTDADDKIILTHDDKHHAWGSTAICNIFTSLTKNMPYCNKKYHSAHVCSATENISGCEEKGSQLYDTYAASELTKIISTKSYANGFYYLHYACATLSCGWSTKPGWLKSQATKEKFFQYRWPKLDIRNLVNGQYNYCNVRTGTTSSPGYLNTANQYTMCGDDLQAYIDQLIPPPGTTLSQSLNSNTYQAGQTLSVSASVSNPGIPKQANVFMGVIHPDGNTMSFITHLEPLTLEQGFLHNPRSFKALINNQMIEMGSQNTYLNLFHYTFTVNDTQGNYQFFTALTWPEAFLDGSIDTGDIISIDLDSFEFMQATE